MSDNLSIPETNEAAFAAFEAEYEWEETNDVTKALIQTGHFLRLLAGEGVATAAMMAVHKALDPQDEAVDAPWWELIEASSYSNELPLTDLFFNLHAYAFYGAVGNEYLEVSPRPTKLRSVDDRREFVRLVLDAVAEFFSDLPPNWDLDLKEAQRTFKAAEARWQLDNDQNLDPEGMSILAGATLKTVRNTISSKGLALGDDGRIPVDQARTWLSARRPTFRPSVWMQDTSASNADLLNEDVFFVPVARDGTCFSGDLARAGRYTIGGKGAEVQVEGFRAALATLHRMAVPHWRRPNAEGNWGIVSGIRWERRTASTLGLTTETGTA